MTLREDHLVELVDADGAPTGSATVGRAHTAPGALHRAYSVILIDTEGRTLLQRRAASKSRFPLRWANACCGHPAPGVEVTKAAAIRLAEELGVVGVSLTEVGVYAYRAEDPATGRVEHEYDHVVIGRVGTDLPVAPDPTEVAETARVPVAVALTDAGDPRYAPWLAGVLRVAVVAS